MSQAVARRAASSTDQTGSTDRAAVCTPLASHATAGLPPSPGTLKWYNHRTSVKQWEGYSTLGRRPTASGYRQEPWGPSSTLQGGCKGSGGGSLTQGGCCQH